MAASQAHAALASELLHFTTAVESIDSPEAVLNALHYVTMPTCKMAVLGALLLPLRWEDLSAIELGKTVFLHKSAANLTTMPHRPNRTGQRSRNWHEDDQSDDGNYDDHHDHLWVAEALARDHERGRDVALSRTERHDPFRVRVRSTEQPTNPKAQCDKQKPGKNSPGTEHL